MLSAEFDVGPDLMTLESQHKMKEWDAQPTELQVPHQLIHL